MRIKQAVARALIGRLPPDEQTRMAADVVAWLCADLPPAKRQEKLELLAPRLLTRLRTGQFGLPLVAYYHLLHLPPLRWLRPTVTPTESRAAGEAAHRTSQRL